MKKNIKSLLLAGLCAFVAVFSVGCGDNSSSSSSSAEEKAATTVTSTVDSESEAESDSEAESSEEDASEIEKEGLWANAEYTKDTELGEGEKTIQVEVKADDKSITFTVHTDKDTLGDLLVDNKLVEGENSTYGLMITKVNGIRADYNEDKAYWALYKDGEYSQTGADSTKVADGEHYELAYTPA